MAFTIQLMQSPGDFETTISDDNALSMKPYLPSTPRNDSKNQNAVHSVLHSPGVRGVLLPMQRADRRAILHLGNRHLAGRRVDQDPNHQGSRKPLPRLLQAHEGAIPGEKGTLGLSQIENISILGNNFPILEYDIRHVSRRKPSQGQSLKGIKGMASSVVPFLFRSMRDEAGSDRWTDLALLLQDSRRSESPRENQGLPAAKAIDREGEDSTDSQRLYSHLHNR